MRADNTSEQGTGTPAAMRRFVGMSCPQAFAQNRGLRPHLLVSGARKVCPKMSASIAITIGDKPCEARLARMSEANRKEETGT
jgi:hypothetical protein